MDLSATENCHCLAARKRAREITRRYEEKLRPHGLRATQFSVLAALALKGPTPLGELADVLGLERTSLTRTANRMEDEGWFQRVIRSESPLVVLVVRPEVLLCEFDCPFDALSPRLVRLGLLE